MSLWLWVSGHVGKDWVGKPPNLDFAPLQWKFYRPELEPKISLRRWVSGHLGEDWVGKPPKLGFFPIQWEFYRSDL